MAVSKKDVPAAADKDGDVEMNVDETPVEEKEVIDPVTQTINGLAFSGTGCGLC